MSSIWTPGGEKPVGRTPDVPAGAPPDASSLSDDEQAQQMLEAILSTPVAAVVVNHIVSLLELAQLHLGVEPSDLEAAQLAIDAADALVEGLPGRLGPDEAELKAGIAQMKLAFVQIRAADLGKAAPSSAN